MLLRNKEVEQQYKIDRNSLLLWESKGLLKCCKTVGGHRRYLQRDIENLLGLQQNENCLRVGFYARVSTRKQEENLNRQIRRIKLHCHNKGYDNVAEFIEIASGLNGRRRQLHKMFDSVIKKEINHIVVEYRDRLARFGIEYIIHLLKGIGCSIEFLEEQSPKEENAEMVEDIIGIVTCFSARIYGKRGRKKEIKAKLGL